MPTDIVSLSREPKEPHGLWMGVSLLQLLHEFPPYSLISLMLETPLLDGQTDREIICQELHCTGNSFIFPAEQPGVIHWTEFHSLRICRMVSSPFPQLLSNTSHAMGGTRARNNGQLAAMGLELFIFSLIC